MIRRIRLGCALAAAASALVLAFAGNAGASPGTMTCGQTSGGRGWCHWGYNYMGPSVNEIVSGGSNYYTIEDVTKNSGGTVYIGFGPSGKHKTFTGQASGSWTPADIGCGGYINPFGQYVSGATSYLYFEAIV
jgi:hypothetical protein